MLYCSTSTACTTVTDVSASSNVISCASSFVIAVDISLLFSSLMSSLLLHHHRCSPLSWFQFCLHVIVLIESDQLGKSIKGTKAPDSPPPVHDGNQTLPRIQIDGIPQFFHLSFPLLSLPRCLSLSHCCYYCCCYCCCC